MPPRPTCKPDGKEIRALIRERGYSVPAFARKIGRPGSAGYINNINSGLVDRVSVDYLRMIASKGQPSGAPVDLTDKGATPSTPATK